MILKLQTVRQPPDMEPTRKNVRSTLSLAQAGDEVAGANLMDIVYDRLHTLAQHFFRSQPSSHTLQPTALVHEVYLKVVGGKELAWQDRAHFFAVCAKAMRSILVDHARSKATGKRGGAYQRIPIEGLVVMEEGVDMDLLDLEQHLCVLSTLHERQARIVECRFYSGMTMPEIAEALGVSTRTVDEDWAMARAWLGMRLGQSE